MEEDMLSRAKSLLSSPSFSPRTRILANLVRLFVDVADRQEGQEDRVELTIRQIREDLRAFTVAHRNELRWHLMGLLDIALSDPDEDASFLDPQKKPRGLP